MLKQIALSINVPNPLQDVAKRDAAEINVVDCRSLNGKRTMMLLDISGPKGETERVIEDLRSLPSFEKIYSTEKGNDECLAIAVLRRPTFCQAAMDSGVLCLRCPLNSKGEELLWDVLIRDPNYLRVLFEKLENKDIHTRVREITEVRRESVLTRRQKEVLDKAINLGYFEFPRRTDLTQLARLLNIKPSSLSEILRSAQRKIMERYIDDMNLQKL